MKIFLHLILFASSFFAQNGLVYKSSDKPVDERVEDLLKRMTLDEKIDMLGGEDFGTKANSRLGIPSLRMTDGPVGIRKRGPATAFPVSIAMAATWDPGLIHKVGAAIGRETKGKGRNVLLGPCVNIVRIPMGGRNFESFGEDPYLTSRMAVSYIEGVQSEGVAATIKHFAANNHEYERKYVDVVVSDRALHEIYFPSFKAAVQEADVLCVMNSYNRLNGIYTSRSTYLLNEVLKDKWGFKGLVVSDWGSVHSSLPTALAGLDLEMPSGRYLNKEALIGAIKNGTLPESTIDDKVRRILRVIFKMGLFDKPEYIKNPTLVNSNENRKVAYETSLASIVLLKNSRSILPLEVNKLNSIAVIGPAAKTARTGGGGSALVTPIDPVSPLTGLKNRISDKVKIIYSEGAILQGDEKGIPTEFLFADNSLHENGLTAEIYDNMELNGEPVVERIDKTIEFNWGDNSPADNVPDDSFSIRWSGYIKAPLTGEYIFKTLTDDGARLWIDDELIIDDWTNHKVVTKEQKMKLTQGHLYKIKLEYYDLVEDAFANLSWVLPGDDHIANAVEAAQDVDCALIFVGTSDKIEIEAFDRVDLYLPSKQEELINRVAQVNKNVVVVITTGAQVVMDNWITNVDGVVQLWFAGTEGGNAIADVLLGNYNPSGKLPVTYPKRWEDCSAFPTFKKLTSRSYYADDIYVGYRHFDTNNIEPLFPFGHGLSYTTFDFSDMNVKDNGDEIHISFDLMNSGDMKGAEIVQLYIADKAAKVDRPVKELKAFKKVLLDPGEMKRVNLIVDKNALKYYDARSKSWKYDPGEFEFMIGSSSKDIRLAEKILVRGNN